MGKHEELTMNLIETCHSASLLKLDGALPSSLTTLNLSGMLTESYVHIV